MPGSRSKDGSRLWRAPIESPWALCALAVVAPLVVPVALAAVAASLSDARTDARWLLLAAVGPAVPVYLFVLPLLPLALRAQRRGLRPRLGPALASLFGLGIAVDVAFYLAGR